MTSYSQQALGQVVRDLRRKQGLTQEELGRAAGYQGGAGVSISRLENGQLEPTPERFAGIATALGLFADVLAQAAEETTRKRDNSKPGGGVSIKDRVTRLQKEIDDRTQLVTDIEQKFADAHDRAKDDFLMKLVEVAARVEGAPPPDRAQLVDDDMPGSDDAEAEAAYGIRFTKFGVAQALAGVAGGAAARAAAGAAAYPAFTAAVAGWTAAAGSGLPGLTRAATSGFLAALGLRTPAARGASRAVLLAGVVATLAAAGGLVWTAQQRNRKQHQELTAKLDEAEAEIVATQPRVVALRELMPAATEILEYVAVHAGHALNRWQTQIGERPRDWQSLSTAQQQRYQEFVEIAAAQLAVTSIDFQGLAAAQGDDLEHATALADEILTQSRKIITSHV